MPQKQESVLASTAHILKLEQYREELARSLPG